MFLCLAADYRIVFGYVKYILEFVVGCASCCFSLKQLLFELKGLFWLLLFYRSAMFVSHSCMLALKTHLSEIVIETQGSQNQYFEKLVARCLETKT